MSEQPNIRRPHDGSIDIDFCPQAALAERRLIVNERPGGAMNAVFPQPARTRPELVIALHCSGSNAAQWRSLEAQLCQSFKFAAPEHYDSGNSPSWTGGHPFTLADEAERTLALIDAAGGGVHLIGHSYGGGVALHVAAARADRIASLALYEPSAFYLLKQFSDGAGPFAEIKAVADMVSTGIRSGDRRNAAKGFVDYWGGLGAWDAIRPPLQDALIRWLPKVSLEFDALFNEPTPWGTLKTLHLPTLIIRGECTPAPTRLIADTLASILPNARKVVVTGAGHMGPLTHASEVSRLIVRHMAAARRDECGCVQSHRNSLRCLTPEQVRPAVNDPIQAPDFGRRLSRTQRIIKLVSRKNQAHRKVFLVPLQDPPCARSNPTIAINGVSSARVAAAVRNRARCNN